MKKICLLLIILILGCTACQRENKQRSIDLPGGTKVYFLNLKQAQQAIVQDKVEFYFDKVTSTDIAIQTKAIISDTTARSEYIARYKSFLQEDVQSFSTEDKDFLANIFREIARTLHHIDPSILELDINLIKVGGRSYGPSVFYTRENNIIIPAYELAKRNEKMMRSILIHELFHIYSRYHPVKKEALYALIGFYPLAISPEELEMPSNLRQTILLNPDGIDYTYAIQLKDKSGDTHQCIPLTSSEFHQYSAAIAGYFPHLTVNFYPVVPHGQGGFKLQTTETGAPPLDLSQVDNSLWEQIGSNTTYIIHPDEILADNFSLLVAEYLNLGEVETADIDKKEQDLLHEMEQIIRGE